MKKTSLKLLCLLLAAVTLLSIVACGKGGESDGTVATTAAAGSNPADQPTEEAKLEPKLPDVKYNTSFNIASGFATDTKYTSTEIISREQNADYINDALYIRTEKVEDQFGITIEVYDVPGYASINNAFDAGMGEYDIGTATLSDIMNIVNHNTCADLNEVSTIDLTMPWWDQNAQQKLCIGDRLFYTCSDFLITGMDNSRVFYFNKDIAQNVNAGSLYALVDNNEWTIDKLRELSLLANQDLNGDGKFDVTNDMLGCSANATTFYEVMLTGCDCEIMKQGDNGIPYFMTFGDHKQTFIDVYTKLLDTFSKDNAYVVSDTTKARDSFMNGNMFFITDTLMYCSKMRLSDSNTNFGIMPVPKLNAEQPNYLHVSPNPDMFFIIDYKDEVVERDGVLLEALSYYSSSYYSDKALIPSYFDLALATRSAPDVESSNNLQIAHDNISYVIKIVGTTFSNQIYSLFADANYSITGIIKSNEGPMNTKLDGVLETFGVAH